MCLADRDGAFLVNSAVLISSAFQNEFYSKLSILRSAEQMAVGWDWGWDRGERGLHSYGKKAEKERGREKTLSCHFFDEDTESAQA